VQVIPNLVGVYVAQAGGFAAVRLVLVLAAVLIGLYLMATVLVVGAGLAARQEKGRPPGASTVPDPLARVSQGA
jgi:hypothetical protein